MSPHHGAAARCPGRRSSRGHWEAIAAADFFSVEVVTSRGLVRYFALFIMRLKTRRVYIAGISQGLDNAWMAQIARNLTDAKDGFLKDVRHLIVDRDPLYTEQFKTILASSAVELLKHLRHVIGIAGSLLLLLAAAFSGFPSDSPDSGPSSSTGPPSAVIDAGIALGVGVAFMAVGIPMMLLNAHTRVAQASAPTGGAVGTPARWSVARNDARPEQRAIPAATMLPFLTLDF